MAEHGKAIVHLDENEFKKGRGGYLVAKHKPRNNSCCPDCVDGCGENCLCRIGKVGCQQECNHKGSCKNRSFYTGDGKDDRIVSCGPRVGKGVQLEEGVKKGEIVGDYTGESINADGLLDLQNKGHDNYVIRYKSRLDAGAHSHLNARSKGNLMRFANHACGEGATCFMDTVWGANLQPRVILIAKRDLPISSMVTFDYNWTSTDVNELAIACQCGTEHCQKSLFTKPAGYKSYLA